MNNQIQNLLNQISQQQHDTNKLIQENNNLKNKINELQSIINNLRNQLSQEQRKNNNLNMIINNLKSQINNQNNYQNINQNNNQNELNIKINKLYDEINNLNKKLKRYPINLEENEKLISIIFSSVDQNTHYSLICKNTDTINRIEEQLYKEYPKYTETENYFLCKGTILNKFQTFDMNNIKNGDVIILNQKE